ncbi:unnamed protein product [Orchesella dallaii]|uniref:Methyltransferase n=1 Tax=Orchesella dallaii TaxID=48710 RepID=A0ABP1RZN7_9HEXA
MDSSKHSDSTSETTNSKSWHFKKQMKAQKQQKLLEQIVKKRTNQGNQCDAVNSKKRTKLEAQLSSVEDRAYPTLAIGGTKSPGPAMAVAGSIIDNAQTPQLKAYLAGQVARAAAIFCVDEIIIYDDTGGHALVGCEQMARILQFLECPQYLRKLLFPIHPDLQFAGIIPPLDLPHHLRRNEALPYREGVVSSRKPVKEFGGGKSYSLVNVGLDRDCRVPKKLPEGVRVTIKFDDSSPTYILKSKGKLKGTAVSPREPKKEANLYWGYSVRIAKSLSKVFSECPFPGGSYDVTVGTSEKGFESRSMKPKAFNNMLIVFGGVQGLEYALENDEEVEENDVRKLFHYYVNTCPTQGSRTIRSEEAILISMSALSHFINK